MKEIISLFLDTATIVLSFDISKSTCLILVTIFAGVFLLSISIFGISTNKYNRICNTAIDLDFKDLLKSQQKEKYKSQAFKLSFSRLITFYIGLASLIVICGLLITLVASILY